MKTFPLCFALLVVVTLVSCNHPNTFRNVPTQAPHALLRDTKYPNAGCIFASHINDHPVSFWRWSSVFRIAPGVNTCETAYSDRKESVSYKAVQFVAHAGCDYGIIRRQERDIKSPLTATPHPTTPNAWIIQDRRDRVGIHETVPGSTARLVAEAPSKACVFGVSSSAAAMADYQQKHPSPAP